MNTTVKVLTLNCWGVHVPVFGAKLRKERINLIGRELSKAEYDIVMLEEIWSQSDYSTLCDRMLPALPYTHYFHSGVVGSGLCLFSKHPIVETHGFPFTLNGYAHKVFHGDWFGRKCVGLAKIQINDIRVNVYLTHLHADYDRSKNEYRGHRVSQAFELSQIIRYTSGTCDLVILGGDLNYRPDEIGYNVVKYNSNVQDSWLDQKRKVVDQNESNTCERHDNCFSTLANKKNKYPGDRIDYLMFRANTGYTTDCETCYVTMKAVPGENFSYSDHEGVAAEFSVRKNITAICRPRETGKIEKHLTDAKLVLDSGIRKVQTDQIFFYVSMFLGIVALVFTADWAPSCAACRGLLGLGRASLTLAIGVFFWSALVMSRGEKAGLTATKKDIDNVLKSNHA